MQHDSPTPEMPDAEIPDTQSDTSAACKHKEVCGRTEHKPGLGYCILHDPNMEKDRKAFDTALAEHRAMLEERREEAKREEGDDYEPRRELRDDFRWMVFPDEVSFIGKTFPQEGVDFGGATFGDRSDFSEATFGDGSDFGGATFGDGSDFTWATFGDRSDFYRATFGDRSDFYRATFGDGSNFYRATFSDESYFYRATFGDGSNFREATFGDGSGFGGTTFGAEADFRKATFGAETDFQKATFGDGSDFTWATFGDGSYFREAEFGDGSDFRWATFGDRSYFRQATFGDGSDFTWATFGDGSSFRETKFGDNTSFLDCTFTGECRFVGTRERLLFASDQGKQCRISFKNATFRDPSKVLFQNVDLSRTLLLPLDPREVEFTNVVWANIEGVNGVYDEEEAQTSEDSVPYAALAKLYRRLKQNYEDNRDYGRGGDFHFREKEMMRRDPTTPLRDRIVLSLSIAP